MCNGEGDCRGEEQGADMTSAGNSLQNHTSNFYTELIYTLANAGFPNRCGICPRHPYHRVISPVSCIKQTTPDLHNHFKRCCMEPTSEIRQRQGTGKITEEAIIPRLLASNALRANMEKHMTLNRMADTKASMIITAASLIITITLTQYKHMQLSTVILLAGAGILALIFSIFAIIPPLHVSGATNLFYFRSFSKLSEAEFKEQFLEAISQRDKLYDAYLHELYFLGKHRLTRKYALIRNGLWTLLGGLLGAIISVLWHNLL